MARGTGTFAPDVALAVVPQDAASQVPDVLVGFGITGSSEAADALLTGHGGWRGA